MQKSTEEPRCCCGHYPGCVKSMLRTFSLNAFSRHVVSIQAPQSGCVAEGVAAVACTHKLGYSTAPGARYSALQGLGISSHPMARVLFDASFAPPTTASSTFIPSTAPLSPAPLLQRLSADVFIGREYLSSHAYFIVDLAAPLANRPNQGTNMVAPGSSLLRRSGLIGINQCTISCRAGCCTILNSKACDW